ncbi:hypothetical protein F7725_025523 [Dissostichus mawsoni]|uniref:Uncharacterized protein n=1 Tax=Dissostichus mawsoni TaxID=36200 RepID=A0A7J5XCC2_DISMA|nr:hypothetical protein F7725_025523 [Dissostichus mawsoni]
MVYHGYILVDISVLCSLWCWKMMTDPPLFEVQLPYAVIAAVTVVAVYILDVVDLSIDDLEEDNVRFERSKR